MTEVNDLAGQHEVIAENLQANVIRELTVLAKDFRDERKKVCKLYEKCVQGFGLKLLFLMHLLKWYTV